jgi:hypothetical protein
MVIGKWGDVEVSALGFGCSALVLRDACEELVKEGLVRAYAWSTDTPSQAAENAGALQRAPLNTDQMAEIEGLLT